MSGYLKRAEPTVNKAYMKHTARLKIDRIVANCPAEVGFFGLVQIKKGFIVIEDVVVYHQEVSSTSVDTSAPELHKVLEEHAEVADKLLFAGHSHANMEAYFSTIDEDQIEEWGKAGVPWIINYVQNKKGEYSARFDQFKPFRMGAELKVITLIPQEIEEWANEELEEKVKVVKASPSSTVGTISGSGRTGWSGSSNDITSYMDQPAGGPSCKSGIKRSFTGVRSLSGYEQEIQDGIVVRCEEKSKGRVWVLNKETHYLKLIESNDPLELEEDEVKHKRHVQELEKKKGLKESFQKGVSQGKAQALVKRASEESRHPTQNPKGVKSGSSADNSDSSSSRQLATRNSGPTLPRLDPDEVVDERDAAQRLSNIEPDQEVITTREGTYNVENYTIAVIKGFLAHEPS